LNIAFDVDAGLVEKFVAAVAGRQRGVQLLAEVRQQELAHVRVGHAGRVLGDVGQLVGPDPRLEPRQLAPVIRDQPGAESDQDDHYGASKEVAGPPVHGLWPLPDYTNGTGGEFGSGSRQPQAGNPRPPYCSSTYSRPPTMRAARTREIPAMTVIQTRLSASVGISLKID